MGLVEVLITKIGGEGWGIQTGAGQGDRDKYDVFNFFQ